MSKPKTKRATPKPYVVKIKVGTIQQIVLAQLKTRGQVSVKQLVLDVDGIEVSIVSQFPLMLPPGSTLLISIEGR